MFPRGCLEGQQLGETLWGHVSGGEHLAISFVGETKYLNAKVCGVCSKTYCQCNLLQRKHHRIQKAKLAQERFLELSRV